MVFSNLCLLVAASWSKVATGAFFCLASYRSWSLSSQVIGGLRSIASIVAWVMRWRTS